MTGCKLAPDKLEKCQAIIDRSLPALEFAQACKECGYPVDDQMNEILQHLDIAQKTKDRFFPESQ